MAGSRENLGQFPITFTLKGAVPESGLELELEPELEPEQSSGEEYIPTPIRIDKFLVGKFPQLSRGMADSWLQAGRIVVNGKTVTKKSQILSAGDEIVVHGADFEASEATLDSGSGSGGGGVAAGAGNEAESGEEPSLFVMRPRPLEQLEILHEDDDVIVLNKPAGLVVHPGAGTGGQTTMVEGLLHYLGRSGTEDGSDLRPGIVHRLDKDTSGAIVWAKNPASQRHLSEQFREKTNLREYIALVIGAMEEPVTATSYQYRDPYNRLRKANMSERDYEEHTATKGEPKGYRRAVSHFYPIKTYGSWLTLVKIRLETGRTHQIRSHALWLNRPVLADPLYGRALTAGQRTQLPATCQRLVAALDRQMLHGRLLGFEHPTTGRKLAFQAPFSPDMKKLLEELEQAT